MTSDSIMIDWALMGDHLLDGYLNDFDNNFKLTRYPQGVFAPFYISEFKSIMNKFDIELLHNVATDGFTHHVKDKIDSLSKEENVYLRGFGSFVVKKRAQKTARNISKNTTIIIPEHNIPAFKPAKTFTLSVKK